MGRSGERGKHSIGSLTRHHSHRRRRRYLRRLGRRLRRRHPGRHLDRQRLHQPAGEAWIYVHNGELAAATAVASGDWLAHFRARRE